MSTILRCMVAAVAAAATFGASAQVDANLENLLGGLTQGTPVTLITPLGNGLVQVTSFTPAAPLAPVEAAAAVERARQSLAVLGVTQPTGLQLATALAGGTVNLPSGSSQIAGVLTQPPQAPPASQVVFAARLPQVAPPAGAIAGQVPGAPSAEQLAAQQLAALGIANPTAQQIQSAIAGGTVTAPNGASYTLPGIQVGSAAVGGTVAPSTGINPARPATASPSVTSPSVASPSVTSPSVTSPSMVSPSTGGAPIVSPMFSR